MNKNIYKNNIKVDLFDAVLIVFIIFELYLFENFKNKRANFDDSLRSSQDFLKHNLFCLFF